MPQDKKKDFLTSLIEEAKEISKYHGELIDYVNRATKFKEKDPDYKNYRSSVYWFTRVLRSLRDKPQCHFQTTAYLISNKKIDSPEAREISSEQAYRKKERIAKKLGILVEELYAREGKDVRRITYCDPHKINKEVINIFSQKELYGNKNFHCPCRSPTSYETYREYYRECNRPEISNLMRGLGVSDIEEFSENYFFEAEALAIAICENKSTFGLLRQFYKRGLNRQTIESIIQKSKEIIEKTRSQ